ncbi:MAG: endolytic transglycosylase MltG [bacterium]
MIRDSLIIALISIFLVLTAVVYITVFAPMGSEGPEQVMLIPEGSGIKSIAFSLESAGLVRSARAFYLLSLFHGKGDLKAGEYAFKPRMSPLEILTIMEQGRVVQHKITIPEGYNIYQTANILDRKRITDKDVFLAYCADPNTLRSWGIEGETVEGYLFPDTYFFSRNIPVQRIVDTMLRRFWTVFTPQMSDRAQEIGYSLHEIVTLASLIEKETALPSERSLISAVFHNRLKERMRLQCDPTVIYGMENYDGNLTKKDLRTVTPYNTYRKRGLPPGPIANPGVGSLNAALYPADVPYRYFVSRNDGSHEFSETLQEHNRAVYKYQKRRKRTL